MRKRPIEFRFGWVLASQILLVLAYPLCRGERSHQQILTLFLALNLAATIRATFSNRVLVASVTVLGGLGSIFAVAGPWLGLPRLVELGDVLFFSFFLVATVAMLRYTLETDHVTFDKICAAFCVYFFLAMFWAMAYKILGTEVPDSFAFSEPILVGRQEPDYFVYLYFSLITVTTLGYGDVTPVSAFAQALASMEAMIGQIYITVLVARLVALHIAQSQTSQPSRTAPGGEDG